MARGTSLSISLTALTGDFVRGMTSAEKATKGLDHSLDGLKSKQLAVREATLRVNRAQEAINRLQREGVKDTNRLEAAQIRLEKAELRQAHATEQLDGKMRRHRVSLRGVASAVGAVGAAYAAKDFAEKSIHTTEELVKGTSRLHKQFGIGVKESSAWVATMKTRGVESDKLSQSFVTLEKKLTGLSQGSKSAVSTFKLLGLSQKDLQGKSFSEQIRVVSDALEKNKGSAAAAGAASQLLGRGWKDLLPVLQGGRKNLDDMVKTAEKYGVTLDGKAIKSTEQLRKAQRESQMASLGLQLTLGRTLVPALSKATTEFNKLVVGFRNGTGTGGKLRDKLEEIWTSLKPTVKAFADVARGVANFAKEHPNVAKLAFQMAAVGLAIKSIKFASKISGLSTFLGAARTGASTFKSIWKGAGDLAGKLAAQRTAESFADTIPGSINARKIRMRSPLLAWGRALGPALGAAIAAGLLAGLGNALKNKLDPENLQNKFGPSANNAWDLIKSLIGRAKGGPVNMPGLYVAGEEAPQHPEFVIATNPKYRVKNMQYFAQAGRALGIPGFKEGGQVSGDTDYGSELGRRLRAMAQATGVNIYVQSGGRTLAEQRALVRAKGVWSPSNPTGAAPANANAPHIRGIAADITPGRSRFSSVASRFGLSFPIGAEPWHVQLSGNYSGGEGGRSSTRVVGATVFTDREGYRMDDLTKTNDTWAELGDGKALGGLPYGAKITVRVNGRTVTLVKRDIGHGGPPVDGHKRVVDIHINAAKRLGLNENWSGAIEIVSRGGVDSRATMAQKRRTEAKKMRAQNIKRAGIRRSVNKGRIERVGSFYETAFTLATLTPGTADDMLAANAGLAFADRQVASLASLARMNPAKYGGALSEAIGNRDTWQGRVGEASGSSADSGAGSQQADLAAELKRFNDFNERTLGVESHTLKKAVADVAAGQIGGMVFRAVQTPMWAGSGARY